MDSELTVLGLFTHGISGFLPNPYFRSYSRFPEPTAAGMMLTGRLDAPTGSTVRRMIDDSLAVEKTGLWGRCYLDGAASRPAPARWRKATSGSTRIATDTAPYLLPTVYDNRPEMFSPPSR